MARNGISLTQARLKELLHYDPETGIFTWLPGTGGKGRPLAPKQAGGFDSWGYRRIWVDGMFYRASHLAWLYVRGEWPERQLDHRDVDQKNDRFGNLRLATQTQNKANSGVYRNNKLGVKGVRRHANGRFEARLRVNGQLIYLGCYKTIEEAKTVYDREAGARFGEFARSA